MEPWGRDGEDLYITCTMPSIEVRTPKTKVFQSKGGGANSEDLHITIMPSIEMSLKLFLVVKLLYKYFYN